MKRTDVLLFIIFPLFFIYVCASVIGIIYFPFMIILKGVSLFNLAGLVISLIGCGLPMLLEFLEEGKVDLRPRFMK